MKGTSEENQDIHLVFSVYTVVNMKRIIFLDIDGTIQDFDGTIPQSTVRAVRMSQKNGHKVCLCTGRPRPRIGEKLLNIGFNGIVASSGSYAEYEGRCIFHSLFEEKDYLSLMTWMVRRKCIVEVENDSEIYVLRNFWEQYKNVTGVTEQNENIPFMIDDLKDADRVDKLVVFCDETAGNQLKEKWGAHFHIVELSTPHNSQWAAEILPGGISKATGIQRILETAGFPAVSVIAVGDSENDLEMLEMAERGIAMGNASDDIKKRADYVTASVKEDGIWKAFQQEGLI